MNIIEYLTDTVDAADIIRDSLYILISLVVWLILWNPIISKLLSKCDVCSFGYELLEMGALQSFAAILGIGLFLFVMVVLMIASVQLVFFNDDGIKIKGILALLLFWGIVGTVIVAIIRSIRKEK